MSVTAFSSLLPRLYFSKAHSNKITQLNDGLFNAKNKEPTIWFKIIDV